MEVKSVIIEDTEGRRYYLKPAPNSDCTKCCFFKEQLEKTGGGFGECEYHNAFCDQAIYVKQKRTNDKRSDTKSDCE